MVKHDSSLLKILFAILILFYCGLAQAAHLYSSNLIETHSVASENKARNSHPVQGVELLSLARLFASIQIKSNSEDKTIYLISELNAERLAEQVLLSLRRLRANQDMHLVIYRRVGGSISSKRYSTGIRVFLNETELNLIFGQLDTFQDDFRSPDRKIAPAGSRHEVHLKGGSIIAANWFEFYQGRNDWMIYPLPKAAKSRLRM
jgi:hypothetical protein